MHPIDPAVTSCRHCSSTSVCRLSLLALASWAKLFMNSTT